MAKQQTDPPAMPSSVSDSPSDTPSGGNVGKSRDSNGNEFCKSESDGRGTEGREAGGTESGGQGDQTESLETQNPPARSELPNIDQLIDEYHGAVYRYAVRLTGNRETAEDVVQQTFLIAHQKLDQLRDIERLGGWLNRIARNCFLKSIRRVRPVDASSLQLAVDEIPRDAITIDSIDRMVLADAVAALPEDYRVTVLMFYFEHLQYNEIAEQLGIKIGTVMSRLSRAKGMLREQLT